MATEVKLPELGENIESAKIVKVLVSEGDSVDDQQPIVEVETDKATAEVPSSASGTVSAIRVSEGDEITAGDVLIVLDGDERGDGEDGEAEAEEDQAADEEQQTQRKKQQKQKEKEKAAAKNGKRKDAKKGDKEKKAVGKHDRSAKKEAQAEPEADEQREEEVADEEEPDRRERKRAEPVGKETRDGQKRPSTGAEEAEEASGVSPADEEPETHLVAAPSVRRIARELGVDLEEVEGSGPGGRITLEDVHQRAQLAPAGAELPDFATWGDVAREPLSAVRKAIAEQMVRSWSSIPHVTLFDEADVTEIERIRQRYEPKAEEAGTKLTLTAVLVKVAAAALHAFPRVNASVDMAGGELVLKHYVHIGFAVETNRGLLVPVIRDANHLNVIELAKTISDLAEKAREGNLDAEEMKGGSFTLTNLGGIGIGRFTPVVNWPEVAILGVGRAQRRPVYRESDFEPRLMMPLSLSFDHRAIDGAEGARFLRWIVSALEEPVMLSMEG